MSRRLIHVTTILVIAVLAVAVTGVFVVKHWLHAPLDMGEETVIRIAPGDTLGKIAYQLAKDDVLTYPRLFIAYARLTDQTRVEVGEYLIAAKLSPVQLLKHFQSGEVVSYTVTLVEGRSVKEFVQTLIAQDTLVITLQGKDDAAIKQLLGMDVDHLEGWFYPDTYRFVRGSRDIDILQMAYQRMKTILAKEWQDREADLPYKSPYEALIMASIVEKETGVAYERAQIAGVFVRRLQIGMRLQTDPTIIYGLGDTYQGNIKRKHLKQKTPYNTYLIDGLPPTPIANPGREAIRAALHPAEGKALYFVAKGDGSHYFSETLTEHNKAVQQYQIKNRKKNYRSAPK